MGALPHFRFPASRRLQLSREFSRVRTEGRTVRGGLLLLGVLDLGDASEFRVGLVTSKRVGGAVMRNRLRRRLREIVRRHQHEVREGVWMVVVTRPAAARATPAALEAEWLKLAGRAAVLLPSAGS
ncbi:MAG: ribonuclease P protein component [Chthoniobacterales bacterium]|nr:ribonuclease P protein component [Chthoniobacterales bacterium]